MHIRVNEGAKKVVDRLAEHGFKAYLVGGCVRDQLLGKEPSEWDITTDALPEQVAGLFHKVVPTGIDYGTVTVLQDGGTYEVTTFRSDEKYIDGRHPSNVRFTSDIHKDLSRRDFTINALAYDPRSGELIDDHGGQDDLKQKVIRTVGDPAERFTEDGLRAVRACRFAAKLGFTIEAGTLAAIPGTLDVAKRVASERLKDELVKMLSADKPSVGLEYMRQTGLLGIILPELEACFGVEQPPEFHPHDVYTHNIYACDAAPKNDPVVRLAALLHDIGKPACKEGMTFYNHDKVSAELAKAALMRLRFSNDMADRVVNLIANHMFDYTPGWSDSAVRRFLRRIGGVGNYRQLFLLREADVKAMKQDIGIAYLKELERRIGKVIEEENALHITDLKVNGNDVIETLKAPPGPVIGRVLNYLLEKVLDDPKLNERDTLLKLIKEYASA